MPSQNPYLLRVEKPWGYELILSPPEASAVAKILHLNQGCRFSLQYHEIKEETLILVNGEANIIWGKEKENLTTEKMEKKKGYFISKGTIHRCQALSDCDIFESSTKEEGTTVRLEDDYKRPDETEEAREKERNTS
ncbi:cupin [Candidatus Microgenomates bacterium]|jgi:mannose-6-phosphate isomerase-like protein (cupin superfamily)|nr:MAG: cupin [Candidatus Microgenomates bacterium]